MAGAGLTRGGFYNHFESKEQLYAAAVASYETCNGFLDRAASADPPIRDPRKLARMMVDLYLSDEVLESPDLHCPLYALPSDVSRAGAPSQRAYTGLIRSMLHVFRSALENAPDAERRAQTVVSLCGGGMVLARTTNDPGLRKSLRAASRWQVLALLDVNQDHGASSRRRAARHVERPRRA